MLSEHFFKHFRNKSCEKSKKKTQPYSIIFEVYLYLDAQVMEVRIATDLFVLLRQVSNKSYLSKFNKNNSLLQVD